MKARRQHLVLAVVGLSLSLLARPAMAVTKTPITFIVTDVTIVSPGTERVGRNTVHVRNQVAEGIVAGDITGTIAIVLNTDLNVTNPSVGFAGIMFQATFAITTETVTWVGRVTDAGPPGMGTNTFVAHGTDGSKILGGLFGQPDGTFLIEGTITAP